MKIGEIIIVVVIIILLVIGNVFLARYYGNKNADLNTLSGISQLKSDLDLFYSYNRFYPVLATATALNDEYAGTQIICRNGFSRQQDNCENKLADVPPGNYIYQSNADGTGYMVKFNLLTAFKNLSLTAGPNCLVDGKVIAGACF